MSEPSQVVKTRTSTSAAGFGGSDSGNALEPSSKQASAAVSKVAWIPQGELDHADWIAAGQRLGAIGRCSQWWIGDWIRYGTTKWGEKYAEAARVTGYDVASLRNMAWVASRFDSSLRNDKLSWSHHVLLAPLETDEQQRWLARSTEERLSVADLRIELRTVRKAGEADAMAEDEVNGPDDHDEVMICPQCGHKMIHVAE